MRLTPRNNAFYAMFAASGQNLVVGAGLLKELLGAEPAERKAIAEKMRAAEHAGDEATHAIMRELNESFITPVRPRGHLPAGVLARRRHGLHGGGGRPGRALPDRRAAAGDRRPGRRARAGRRADRRGHAAAALDEGPQEFWIELNRLENQADQVYRRLLARLFSGDYDALTVLKLKEVVDQLEAAADAFEHVANTVETIAVKES